MRIALVGDYPLNPNKIKGGPQAVFAYLIQGLKRFTELELHIVTAHTTVEHPYTVETDGVHIHYLPYPPYTTFRAYPQLKKAIHKALQQINPDIVHGQSAYVFGCIALQSNYVTVLTPHSIYGTEVRFAKKWVHRQNLRLQHFLMRRCFLARSRYILSINPYIRQNLQPYVNAKFYDIDNPISRRFFELDPAQAQSGEILFVGWLRQVKRPDLALKAFALAKEQAPNLHLKFAGGAIEPALKADLQRFITQNNLTDSVTFLGHLSQDALLKAYQQMSILLLTSELETSPMAVGQAMAAAKPVVATKVGGVPYLLDNARTGFVVNYNKPQELAQALLKLAESPELRQSIGAAARQEALARFKVEQVAQKTYQMYRDILADAAG